MTTKYIFVIGGVVSSLGKGITAASIGRIMKQKNLRVFMQKFDPYINVDPGTISPYQHGEVFVTSDGAETDLDLGHYERFIDENLTQDSNVTAGRIYQAVIEKERKGIYKGKTVQVIPHITDEIKARILKPTQQKQIDIVITEIGGTVGDIESLAFLEAIRQICYEKGKGNVAIIHTTLVPYLNALGEFKTKPSQHSVKELLSLGIQPDILVCRSEKRLPNYILEKISLFCNIRRNYVINIPDCKSIYEVPLILSNQNIDVLLSNLLGLDQKKPDMSEWKAIHQKIITAKITNLKVAIIGKYAELSDAYLSVIESLKIAAFNEKIQLTYKIIVAEIITSTNVNEILAKYDGIIVPGGFGFRGVNGKILAINYARVNKIPFLGICLGMQLACIEFARNCCGLLQADSTEFDKTTVNPIFAMLPVIDNKDNLGGTLRLGDFTTVLKPDSLANKLYKALIIKERHRHRYEFNNQFRSILAAAGLIFSGIYEQRNLVEIIELPTTMHPFFIACQYHPEYTSRINRANPLFIGFVKAILKKL